MSKGHAVRNSEQHLTQYAAYHRDRRNIATHFVGVPMIVLSVVLALAQINVAPVHGGWIASAFFAVYYLWLDRLLGVAMTGFLVVCCVASSLVSAQTGGAFALGIAFATFITGWIIQFAGHHYEGVRPAFIDDLMGFAIGPLFMTAEIFFLAGSKHELRKYIEDRVGTTMAARDGKPIGPIGTPAAANSANQAA